MAKKIRLKLEVGDSSDHALDALQYYIDSMKGKKYFDRLVQFFMDKGQSEDEARSSAFKTAQAHKDQGVPSDPIERHFWKARNFGRNYGMSAAEFKKAYYGKWGEPPQPTYEELMDQFGYIPECYKHMFEPDTIDIDYEEIQDEQKLLE